VSTHILPSFDTLQYVKRLKAADVPEKQAEAQAEALREALVDQFSAQAEASVRLVEEADTRTEHALLALDKRVGTLEKKVDALDKKVDALDKKVDALDKKVYALDKKVDTGFVEVRGEITLLRWMLGTLIAGVAALVLKAYF